MYGKYYRKALAAETRQDLVLLQDEVSEVLEAEQAWPAPRLQRIENLKKVLEFITTKMNELP